MQYWPLMLFHYFVNHCSIAIHALTCKRHLKFKWNQIAISPQWQQITCAVFSFKTTVRKPNWRTLCCISFSFMTVPSVPALIWWNIVSYIYADIQLNLCIKNKHQCSVGGRRSHTRPQTFTLLLQLQETHCLPSKASELQYKFVYFVSARQ